METYRIMQNNFAYIYSEAHRLIKEGDLLRGASALKFLVKQGEKLYELNPNPEIMEVVDKLKQEIKEL